MAKAINALQDVLPPPPSAAESIFITAMNFRDYVASQLAQGINENIFHNLLEAPHEIIPELITHFRNSTNSDTREFLVKVIWEHRQPSTIPFLSEALLDSDDQVWKAAMAGLVASASPEAIEALISGKIKTFKKESDKDLFLSWLDEAIDQAATKASGDEQSTANTP